MKNFQGRHILLISLWLWVAIVWTMVTLPQRAEADEASAAYAIELVNQIRQDPLAYAETLGYNRDSLLASLPWLESELSQGIPALSYSDTLTQEAVADESDQVLITAEGYNTSFARTGKISGAVSFANFMDPAAAVQIIVENQFVQELSPGYDGQRCILSTELGMAGATFGATTINGANAYVLTICLASATLKTDQQILNQINQLRADPVTTGAALNMDLSGYVGVYPPLFSNNLLENFAASTYAADPYFRIHLQNFGYAGYGVGKVTALGDFPKSDLNTVAFWMFSSLVVNEVKGLGDGSSILGPYLNDVGLNLVYVSGDAWDHVSLSVIAGLGADTAPELGRVCGLVYNDADQNGIFTPGEERAERSVQIYRADTLALVSVVTTDNTGYFEVELDTGVSYAILTGAGETLAEDWVTLSGDQFLSLKVAD